jgi:hypothetical protein
VIKEAEVPNFKILADTLSKPPYSWSSEELVGIMGKLHWRVLWPMLKLFYRMGLRDVDWQTKAGGGFSLFHALVYVFASLLRSEPDESDVTLGYPWIILLVCQGIGAGADPSAETTDGDPVTPLIFAMEFARSAHTRQLFLRGWAEALCHAGVDLEQYAVRELLSLSVWGMKQTLETDAHIKAIHYRKHHRD